MIIIINIISSIIIIISCPGAAGWLRPRPGAPPAGGAPGMYCIIG